MAYQKDISAVLGLSVSTVSRALRGYHDISEETRRKVLKTAEELDYNYQREEGPKTVRRAGSAVGVLVPGSAELMKLAYYREMVCGMAAEAAAGNRDLVIMGEEAAEQEMSWIGRAAIRKVDGICLLASRDDLYKGRFSEVLRSGIPLVSVENDIAGRTSVCGDFRENAKVAMNYLKEKGHRKTAYLGDLSLDSRKYASILEEEAQKLDMGFVEMNFGEERAATPFGNPDGGVTCVIFTSHSEASDRIGKWEKDGIRIPEDLSVVVLETGRDYRCPDNITCVRESPAEIGRESVRRLIHIVEHPESDAGEIVQVSGDVLEGNTVRDFSGKSARNF